MLQDLTLEQRLLANLMNDLSERCYSAGWMMNLEYVLWDAISNGPREFGRDVITQNDINELKHLSDNCNCWIYFDDEEEEIAIDLLLWQQKFNEELGDEPNILNI